MAMNLFIFMEIPNDLDGILAQSKQEGILVKVDERWTGHKIFRFVLDSQIADDAIEQLIAELSQNPLYYVISNESRMIENGYKVQFGYRRAVTWQSKYRDLHPFATVSVLDFPIEEKFRLEKEGKDAKNKSIFVIDGLDTYDGQQATLYLMRTFYSIYQKLKTPSET